MNDRRKNPPKKHKKNERREDLQIIRTRVSQNEMYVWAICLSFILSTLVGFIVFTFLK
jgi:hypothetical protein